MKKEKGAVCVLLVLSILFLLLLILSDFGIIFPSEHTSARVLLHFSAIFLIISSVIQLYRKKED